MGIECAMWEITPAQLDMLLECDKAVDALACGEKGAIKAKCLDLGKAWGVIDFLVTGGVKDEDDPLSWAIGTGYLIGEESIDGAVYLPPDEVKEVAEALSALQDDVVQDRMAPRRLKSAGVYHSPWNEEELQETMKLFERLRSFYRNAANKGNAVLRHTG